MQDVTAWELLRAGPFYLAGDRGVPRTHFFSADDAGILAAQFFGCGVWILVHVSNGLTVSEKSA